MATPKECQLDMVTDAIDHLITVTIEWFVVQESQTNHEQLVLTSERINALRRLQKISHKELKSATNKGMRIWQVVNLVIAAIVRYALDRLSDSLKYKLCREQHNALLFTACF